MAIKIRYLGISAFEITTEKGLKIFMDPFIEGERPPPNPFAPIKAEDITKADLILVSHGARDHIGDTVDIAKRTGAIVVCGGDVKEHVIRKGVSTDKIVQVTPGGTIKELGIKVACVEAKHASIFKSNGVVLSGPPLGYVVYVEPGLRIYHAGDTGLFGDMKLIGELHRPNIGMIPVGDIVPSAEFGPEHAGSVMLPYDAALAANWIGLEIAIPMHYPPPPAPASRNPELFSEFMKVLALHTRVLPMKPGETYKFEKRFITELVE